jgi:hypothetical protein
MVAMSKESTPYNTTHAWETMLDGHTEDKEKN